MKKMIPDIQKSRRMILSHNAKSRLLVLRRRRVATVRVQSFRRAQILLAMLHKYHHVVSAQKWYRGNKMDVFARSIVCLTRVRDWYRARKLLNALRDRNYIVVLQQFTRKFIVSREWARLRVQLLNRKSLTMLSLGTKQIKVKLAMYKFVRVTQDLSKRWNAARRIQRVFRGHRARVHFRDTMRRVAIACHSVRVEISAEILTRLYFTKYVLIFSRSNLNSSKNTHTQKGTQKQTLDEREIETCAALCHSTRYGELRFTFEPWYSLRDVFNDTEEDALLVQELIEDDMFLQKPRPWQEQ